MVVGNKKMGSRLGNAFKADHQQQHRHGPNAIIPIMTIGITIILIAIMSSSPLPLSPRSYCHLHPYHRHLSLCEYWTNSFTNEKGEKITVYVRFLVMQNYVYLRQRIHNQYIKMQKNKTESRKPKQRIAQVKNLY